MSRERTEEHTAPARPTSAGGREVLLVAFPAPQCLPVPPSDERVGREWLAANNIDDSKASRHHIVFTRRGGVLRITDLGSRNGTWVNGSRLRPNEEVAVEDGFIVRVGRTLLVYRRAFLGPDVPFAPIGTLISPFGLWETRAELTRVLSQNPANVLVSGETGMAKVRSPGDPISGKNADEWKKIRADGCRHVQYERDAFDVQYALFPHVAVKGGLAEIPGVRNAVYEATMVHFRNLCDFLSPPSSRQDDDITAGDYVLGWAHAFSDIVEDARNIVNKQVVHISYCRSELSDAGQKLPWDAMAKEVHAAWDDFIAKKTQASATRKPARPPEAHVTTQNTASTTIEVSSRDFAPAPPARKPRRP